jgi:hypothetical protein
MKVKVIDGGTVFVTLSKRNLLALLSKVDDETSAKTLNRAADPQNPEGEPTLFVVAEPDDTHYSDRDYGPGIVRSKDEKFVQENGGVPGTELYGWSVRPKDFKWETPNT